MAGQEDRARLLRLPSGRGRSAGLSAPPGERLEIALAIVVRDGRVLVVQRGDDQHLPRAWEFPGGKIGEGEDPEAAALRELREETGLAATDADPLLVFLHDYPDRRLRFHAFVVHDPSGEPAVEAGRPFRWMAPAALQGLPMPEANAAILRALRWRLT